jgi:hypothetical protein
MNYCFIVNPKKICKLPIKTRNAPAKVNSPNVFAAIIVQPIIVPDNKENPPAKTNNRALLTIYFVHLAFVLIILDRM